jgi:hypothetical protein
MPRRRRPFRGCVNSEVGGGDEGALARDQGPLDGVCSSRMLPGQGCRCSTSRASRLSVTSALPILGPSVRMKWSSRAPHPTRVRAAQAGARCTVKTASRYKGSLPNRPAAILRHRVPVGRGDKADTGLERRRSPRAAGTPAPAARGGASPAPRPRARRPRRGSPAGGQVEAPGRSRRSSIIGVVDMEPADPVVEPPQSRSTVAATREAAPRARAAPPGLQERDMPGPGLESNTVGTRRPSAGDRASVPRPADSCAPSSLCSRQGSHQPWQGRDREFWCHSVRQCVSAHGGPCGIAQSTCRSHRHSAASYDFLCIHAPLGRMWRAVCLRVQSELRGCIG